MTLSHCAVAIRTFLVSTDRLAARVSAKTRSASCLSALFAVMLYTWTKAFFCALHACLVFSAIALPAATRFAFRCFDHLTVCEVTCWLESTGCGVPESAMRYTYSTTYIELRNYPALFTNIIIQLLLRIAQQLVLPLPQQEGTHLHHEKGCVDHQSLKQHVLQRSKTLSKSENSLFLHIAALFSFLGVRFVGSQDFCLMNKNPFDKASITSSESFSQPVLRLW